MGPRRDLSRLFHVADLVVLAMAFLAPSASAQSLADVAREAEARRQMLDRPGKVYTNDSLHAEPTPAGPVVPAASTQVASARTEPVDAKTESESPRSEQYWRERMEEARSALSRAEAFASALRSQVDGLYAEFTACGAPRPQCDDIAERRQKSLAELDRVNHEVATYANEVATIQDEARRAGVPAGWVR